MSTRIHVDLPLAAGQALDLPAEAAHHLLQVLRCRVGEPVVLFNGDGREYPARLTAAEKRRAAVQIEAVVEAGRESPLALLLAQCVSKGERMDYTVQKAVELGVSAIQPLLSERSVVRLDAQRWEKKLAHWRGVIVSACQQCGRNRLPVLQPVMDLQDWLGPAEAALKLVLAPGGARTLRELPRPDGPVLLLVGPEGGLSETELAAAEASGFERLGLGPRVLRTETAGVAALAALQTLWGDLG